ncbi:hypothetical protein JCM24511_07396 [Saitozyma sp. JCM 24511]|nr:hypothetical protein JCM24511_07396 [Saitozyma sp. JCM 24511]
MAPLINTDVTTVHGPFGKSWVDQYLDQDDFWNEAKLCHDFHSANNYKVQPLGHTPDRYFPTSAFRYGLQRWIPDADTTFNVPASRGPKCEVRGEKASCHANGYIPTFFYTHPDITCSVTEKKGLPTIVCRWHEDAKLQACWICYVSGSSKCPIGNIHLKLKSAEDNSKSTGSARSKPPPPKKTQPPAKIPIGIRPKDRRKYELSEDEQSENGSVESEKNSERSEAGDQPEGHPDEDELFEDGIRKRKRSPTPPFTPYTPYKRRPNINPKILPSTGSQQTTTPSAAEQRPIVSPAQSLRPPTPSDYTPPPPPAPAQPRKPANLPHAWLEARKHRVVTDPNAVTSSNTASRPGFGGLSVPPPFVRPVAGAVSNQPPQPPNRKASERAQGQFESHSGSEQSKDHSASQPLPPPNHSGQPLDHVPEEFKILLQSSETIRKHVVDSFGNASGVFQQVLHDLTKSFENFKSSAEPHLSWWSDANQAESTLLLRLESMRETAERVKTERDQAQRHLRAMEDAWNNSEALVKNMTETHQSAAKKRMTEKISALEARVETMQQRFGVVVNERQVSDEKARAAEQTRDAAMAEADEARGRVREIEAELLEAEQMVALSLQAKEEAEASCSAAEARASAAEQRVAVVEALLHTTQGTIGKASVQVPPTQPVRNSPTWVILPKQPDPQKESGDGMADDEDADLYV